MKRERNGMFSGRLFSGRKKAAARQEEEIQRRVEEITAQLMEENRKLSNVSESTLEMVGDIVECRSAESGQHIRRVKQYTRILADKVRTMLPEYGLTLYDVDRIAQVSVLHDVGKIAIPDSILLKPGRLTAEEMEHMKTHAEVGRTIVRRMRSMWPDAYLNAAEDICAAHHERWDGNGYPNGTKGDEIPIAAQIVSVADVYDALTCERCYGKACAPEEAAEMLHDGRCGAFSKKLMRCFSACEAQFAEYARSAEAGGGMELMPEFPAVQMGQGTDRVLPALEEMAESMPGGFLIFRADDSQELLFVNSTLVSIMGCETVEELESISENSFRGLLHPADRLETARSIYDQVTSGKDNLVHVTCRALRRDGIIRWFDCYGRLTRSAEYGESYYVFIRDFTDIYNRRRGAEAAQIAHQERQAFLRNLSAGETPDQGAGPLKELRVLLVDDADSTRSINKEILESEGAVVFEAKNGLEAVQAVQSRGRYDLVLMDLVMPVMNGVTATKEIVRYLEEKQGRLPVIGLTAAGSDMQVQEFMQAGAYGCLYKPLNVSELSRLMLTFARETAVIMNRQLQDAVRVAYTDALTNVKSVSAYSDKVASLNRDLREFPETTFAAVVCDCDNLKRVNDTYGHDVGDRYIRNCCRIICKVFAHSPVFRTGGDEFTVLVQSGDFLKIDELMETLDRMVTEAENIDSVLSGRASLSAGIAVFDRNMDRDVGDTVKRADTAMYRAKAERHTQERMEDGRL